MLLFVRNESHPLVMASPGGIRVEWLVTVTIAEFRFAYFALYTFKKEF